MGIPMVIRRGVLGLLAAGLAGGAAWGKSFQVYPPPEASAYFRLYQGPELTREIGSPVGGLVYVTLYIRLGPATRVHENTESITVTVTDQYPNYWEGTNVVKEFDPFGISDEWGWQRKAESEASWTGSPGPGHGANGATEPVFYRRTVCWNSMKEPLGNNGEHTIASTPIWLVGSAGGDAFHGGPAAVKAQTENVYITDVECSNGTIDYFKWDPDSEDEALRAPVISFKIKDAAPSAKYHWTLWYRETGLEETVTDELGRVQPIWGGTYWGVGADVDNAGEAGSVEVTVPLTTAAGQHLVAGEGEWGTYTYDIMVSERDASNNEIDWNVLKTPYTLWVEPEDAEATNLQSGHALRTATVNEAPVLQAVYKLNNQCNEPAANVSLIPIDPALRERTAFFGPTSIGAMHGAQDADQDGEPDWLTVYSFAAGDLVGRWRVVWTGEARDGEHSPYRRTHDRQRMVAANAPSNPTGSSVSSSHNVDPNAGCANISGNALRSAKYELPRGMVDSTTAIGVGLDGGDARKLISLSNIVAFYGHSRNYTQTLADIKYHAGAGIITDIDGDGNPIGPDRHDILYILDTDRENLDRWHDAATMMLAGPSFTRKTYERVGLLVLMACATDSDYPLGYATWGQRWRSNINNNTVVLGFNRFMDVTAAKKYLKFFWQRFSSDEYREKWQKGLSAATVQNCAESALDDWWNWLPTASNYDTVQIELNTDHKINPSDPGDDDPTDEGRSSLFVVVNERRITRSNR